MSQNKPNVEKLFNLGFEPTVSLNEGLLETYSWYVSNKNNYQRYDAFNGNKDYANI